MRTVRLMFICMLFSNQVASWSALVVWSFPGLVHVKTIAVFITHVQYLAETLPSNICLGKHQ